MKNETENRGLSLKKNNDRWMTLLQIVLIFVGSRFFFMLIFTCFWIVSVFLFCFLIFCGFQCARKYFREKRKILNRCEGDLKKRNEYSYNLDLLKVDILNLFFIKHLCVFGKMLFYCLVMILVMHISNPESAKAYYDKIKTTLEEDKSRDSICIGSNSGLVTEVQEEIGEENDLTGLPVKKKDPDWRFVLIEHDESEYIDVEKEDQVFFYYTDQVLDSMQQICDENRIGVDCDLIQDGDENKYDTYTDLENSFKERVNKAMGCRNYDDWLKNAPHATELEYYIYGRERLNQVSYKGERGCYKIWYQLANDYQYYAQEFERQTDNKMAIRYYYINCIYCCIQGLKYSISKKEEDELYHYMVMRYHDMADENSKVFDEDRKRASVLHSLLVKEDPLSNSDVL